MKTTMKFTCAVFAIVTLAIGALPANGAPGDLFASINGAGGNTAGFIYEYTPNGIQNTFAPSLSRPRGVAFGNGGTLFVANTTFDNVNGTFQGSIVKISQDGSQNLFATIGGNVFLEGLAFDDAGNLFLVAIDNNSPVSASTIYKITPRGVLSTFGSLPGQGLGLAFDKLGNLLAADFSDQTIYKFTPDGTRTVFAGPSAFQTDGGPVGLAFDALGNLFASEGHDPTVRILKFTNGVESEFATGVQTRGLAFDKAGNLFGADLTAGEILRFTSDGSETVFASGIPTPEFLAFYLLPTPPPHPTPPPRP